MQKILHGWYLPFTDSCRGDFSYAEEARVIWQGLGLSRINASDRDIVTIFQLKRGGLLKRIILRNFFSELPRTLYWDLSMEDYLRLTAHKSKKPWVFKTHIPGDHHSWERWVLY